MVISNYEPHIVKNPLLPFIFHHEQLVSESIYANWHVNIELIYCLSGMGKISCDGETFEMKPGELYIFNSNKIHCIGTDTNVEYYCLIIDKDFCAENGINSEEVIFREKITSDAVSKLFLSVFDANASKDEYTPSSYVLNVRIAVLKLLFELSENHIIDRELSNHCKSVSLERTKEAIRYIRKNLSSPLSLDDIADYCCMSKCYLSREFKKNTGQNVFEYINILRCKEAKKLILGGMSASAAALSCGFENMSYFSRTYKRYIGTLPSKTT